VWRLGYVQKRGRSSVNIITCVELFGRRRRRLNSDIFKPRRELSSVSRIWRARATAVAFSPVDMLPAF
jgi:hypothetical protein